MTSISVAYSNYHSTQDKESFKLPLQMEEDNQDI